MTCCPVSAWLAAFVPGKLMVALAPATLKPVETKTPSPEKLPLASGVVLAGVLALRVLVSVMVPEVPSLTS